MSANLIEGRVAEIACNRITPQLLGKLGRINAVIKTLLAKKEIGRALAQNLDFHLTRYKASGVDVMLPMIEMLWRQAGPFIALSPSLLGVRWTARYHDEIIRALKAGSPSKTRRAVQLDVEDTLQELLKHAAFEGEQEERSRSYEPAVFHKPRNWAATILSYDGSPVRRPTARVYRFIETTEDSEIDGS